MTPPHSRSAPPIREKAAASTPEREFAFTDEDFERIRRLIHRLAGIALSPAKRDMVYSRLARRLRSTGHRSFADYLARLESGDAAELEAFTNALTTNLTAFFREAHHFSILQDFLRTRRDNRQINIWCAAASTGEEAYSLAIAVAELFGGIPAHVRILASDVDTAALADARAARYGADRVRKLPEALLARYFLSETDGRSTLFAVRPEVQSLVSWRRINLLDEQWPVRGPLDAIFCRNVMIYFDRATQRRLLEKFVPLLAADGLLFVGHAESLHHASDLFRLRGQTVYELAPEARARAWRP
jgi:chemotaxis protein methyltransferase CheR